MTSESSQPLLSCIRCPSDGAPLRPGSGVRVCAHCATGYRLRGRVLELLPAALQAETEYEQGVRDEEATSFDWAAMDADDDFMAVRETLAALAPSPTDLVLEMGAGTGRFTRHLLPRCRGVVAMDISMGALSVLAAHAPDDAPIALVQADATLPATEAGSFDRVLGTLLSNLPDREARAGFYRTAARALRPEGVLVLTAHHYGLRARLDHEARVGRYDENGIHRQLFTGAEIAAEMAPWFGQIRVRPISVMLPFTPRLGSVGRPLNRIAARLPGLRRFGQLLLVEARSPRSS